MEKNNLLPVAIIGAGPVGLSAAAHLTLRNQPFILFERGSTVATNVLSWKHVRLFSPWKYNLDNAARQLLQKTGWQMPSEDGLPTGWELYQEYLKPLSELPGINDSIVFNANIVSIGRKNIDKLKTHGRSEAPYLIRVMKNKEVIQYEVKAVIDASGTWNSPNPIGAGGTYAIGETENCDKIFYGIPDVFGEYRERYANKNVMVVGGGHSSVNVILELDKLKDKYPRTTIHWVLRKNNIQEVYGGQEKDALAARGALGIKIETLASSDRVSIYTPFLIEQITNNRGKLNIVGYQHEKKFALPGIDEIICNTGSRPEFSFLREVRLNLDPALESVSEIAELIDPNVHSCGTVRAHGEKQLRHPDKNFYIVGSKSYGRAPTFLMATGYEQVRSVVAFIAGDVAAAENIELNLPETGVCSVDIGDGACCGNSVGEAKKKATSCCG